MEMSMASQRVLRDCLREGATRCSNRGLLKASEWALEQLLGTQDPSADAGSVVTPFNEQNADDDVSQDEFSADSFLNISSPLNDLLMFSRSLIVGGEYQRCAFLLRRRGFSASNTEVTSTLKKGIPHLMTSEKGQKLSKSQNRCLVRTRQLFLGLFLASYAEYMAGEKLRDQTIAEKNSNNSKGTGKKGKQTNAGNEVGGRGTVHDDEETTSSDTRLQLYSETEKQSNSKNSHLQDLCYRELLPLYQRGLLPTECEDSSFLLYLLGVVLRDLRRQEGTPIDLVLHEMHQDMRNQHNSNSSDGISVVNLFADSIKAFPWNWSCWLELAELCTSDARSSVPEWPMLSPAQTVLRVGKIGPDEQKLREESAKLMYGCFLIRIYLEKHCGEQALQVLESLLHVLPFSLSLYTEVGLAQYSLRRYDDAEQSFELLREQDPYRLCGLDTYSNILYVKEKHADLSHLAHSVIKVDKFCAESCCVVGNYYSLKGRHERAVLYFQRALRLDSRYLSAWTLMGHEYMELRNAAAAVQCYRNAVGLSDSDYRAWYGLGQTYEMLHLYQYANYYFRKAAYLRPSDARMWSAVGNCQLKLGMRAEAIASYERAVGCGDREGIATRDLARLCREDGQIERAAYFYYKFLQSHHNVSIQVDDENEPQQQPVSTLDGSDPLAGATVPPKVAVDTETAEPLLFIASHFASLGQLSSAEAYCSRLLGFIGPEGDEARALLRTIKSSPNFSMPEQNLNISQSDTRRRESSLFGVGGPMSSSNSSIDITPSQLLRQEYTAMQISSGQRIPNSRNNSSNGSNSNSSRYANSASRVRRDREDRRA